MYNEYKSVKIMTLHVQGNRVRVGDTFAKMKKKNKNRSRVKTKT